jgi:hypothetical protein
MGGIMKCLVNDCDSSVRVISLGLCYKHYVRQKTHGTTEVRKYSRGTLEERFWNFVDKKSQDECWHWIGQILSNGYGRISLGAKKDGSEGAHRVSWKLHNKKDIPDGMYVMHKCDNPSCVNPNHLSIGTPKDNTQDMIGKGRKKVVSPKGEGNGKSLLDAEKVRLIRSSTLNHAALGRQLGVSPNCIRGVRTGRTWSHIEDL